MTVREMLYEIKGRGTWRTASAKIGYTKGTLTQWARCAKVPSEFATECIRHALSDLRNASGHATQTHSTAQCAKG